MILYNILKVNIVQEVVVQVCRKRERAVVRTHEIYKISYILYNMYMRHATKEISLSDLNTKDLHLC